MQFFLGIDGGGTKTRCALGDAKSQLATGSSSSCRVQKVGEACARDSLSAAIHEACVQAGVSPHQIVRTCAGITGAARPEIADVMRTLISSVAGGDIEVVGDTNIAFEDAFGDGAGVVVIAGTGAIAYGRNGNGETARASGWGPAISDEGSGYWIGAEAVRQALHAHDSRGQRGLLDVLIAGFGAKDFDDFIVRVNAPAPDFSRLLPAIAASAEGGDKMAIELLGRAAHRLAASAKVVIDRLFAGKPCQVATHGGVFSGSSIVSATFSEALAACAPQAKLLDKIIDPARGALQRARRGADH